MGAVRGQTEHIEKLFGRLDRHSLAWHNNRGACKTAPWPEGQQMALGFSSLSCTTNAKGGCPATDADMLATVMRIISLLIAAVTIGDTIGKKK